MAPWAAPLSTIALGVIQSRGWPFGSELPWVIGFSVLAAYVCLIVAGLPIVHVLRRIGHLNLVSLSLLGVLAGILVFYGFGQLLVILFQAKASFGLAEVLWGAWLGFSVALVFGLIAGLTFRSTGRLAGGAARRPLGAG